MHPIVNSSFFIVHFFIKIRFSGGHIADQIFRKNTGAFSLEYKVKGGLLSCIITMLASFYRENFFLNPLLLLEQGVNFFELSQMPELCREVLILDLITKVGEWGLTERVWQSVRIS